MTTTLAPPRANDTHSILIGYICWLFGFMGAHRFYYGKKITGTIWFFTLGLLFIGWIVDLFLIPGMHRDAERRYQAGPIDYTVAWILLTFLGAFGVHRFYLGKWVSALAWLVLAGLLATGWFILAPVLGIAWLYDLWTLNEQVSDVNARLTSGIHRQLVV